VYLLLMTAQSLWIYGRKFRTYIFKTPAANWVRSKADQALADAHVHIDAVISVAAISRNFHGKRRGNVRYAILTDHVNLLSKRSPDFGCDIPERGVADAWNRVEAATLRAQDYNFVLGHFVKESMVRDYGVDPAKVVVVGAGPNLDVDAERDRISKDYSQKNVLFVGLDAHRKGLPVLLRAFARVVDRFPKAKLHVAGVDGADGDGIAYHGIVTGEALKKLFYDAQLFVLPSLREPFGIVLLEAMWAKTACIGTKVGAMPEIITEGETGYLVEPGDSDELAEKLIDLLGDPQRLRAMAENGYRAAKERFGWDRAASIISSCLLEDAPVELVASSVDALLVDPLHAEAR
jgi:glycosyltransferase involved in cell wall biosynthesis